MFTATGCCATVEIINHPPLRRHNSDLREVGGLITAETVTPEFPAARAHKGARRREGQA